MAKTCRALILHPDEEDSLQGRSLHSAAASRDDEDWIWPFEMFKELEILPSSEPLLKKGWGPPALNVGTGWGSRVSLTWWLSFILFTVDLR
jgi:hypothetical protein